jgi:hypothetical protein
MISAHDDAMEEEDDQPATPPIAGNSKSDSSIANAVAVGF